MVGFATEYLFPRLTALSRLIGSDIIYVNVAGTSVLILNSLKVVHELLEKKSRIYSSRCGLPRLRLHPRFNAALQNPSTNGQRAVCLFIVYSLHGKLPFSFRMGWKFAFSFLPNNEIWRSRRHRFHQEFNPKAALRFRPQQLKSTYELLRRLLDTPEDWMQHLRQYVIKSFITPSPNLHCSSAGSTTMSITYGIDILPKDDPYIDVAEKAVAALSIATIPGKFLVDQFSIRM